MMYCTSTQGYHSCNIMTIYSWSSKILLGYILWWWWYILCDVNHRIASKCIKNKLFFDMIKLIKLNNPITYLLNCWPHYSWKPYMTYEISISIYVSLYVGLITPSVIQILN